METERRFPVSSTANQHSLLSSKATQLWARVFPSIQVLSVRLPGGCRNELSTGTWNGVKSEQISFEIIWREGVKQQAKEGGGAALQECVVSLAEREDRKSPVGGEEDGLLAR